MHSAQPPLTPFSLLHGEPLVACAAWALGASGVSLVDDSVEWERIVGAVLQAQEEIGETGVWVAHDPLCPMTPPEFIAACVQEARESGQIVVGARPVTDTVKVVEDGVVGATVPREELRLICAPVVVPAGLIERLDGPPGPDLVAFVAGLDDDLAPRLVVAPTEARRVQTSDELAVLGALTSPAGA